MPFLYHVLATPIIQQITSQSITAHSKLPSLRSFAQQHAVSLSTAQACYVWLEAQGYIYAKKKSGYFVQPQHNIQLPPLKMQLLSHLFQEKFQILLYSIKFKKHQNKTP